MRLIHPTSILSMFLSIIIPVSLQSCSGIVQRLGGAFKYEPEEMENQISSGAKQLIEKSLEGSEGNGLIDYHTHVIGLGTDCKDCFVHPDLRKFSSPLQRFKFDIYMNASGIKNPEKADQEYVDRLVRLNRSIDKPVKSAILAFDKHFNIDGSENLEKTQFYVPNSYVYQLSRKYPVLIYS